MNNKKRVRKEQIIEASVRVFAQKGFYNAKVADVAREAGVADGTIYLYFKNKDDLLISLFETKMEEILQRFSAILELEAGAADKLLEFFKLYFRFIEDDPQLAEVFQVELRQSGKFLKDYHNQKFIDFLNLIGRIITEGQDNGEFRSDLKINTMKLAIFGAIDELARQWILSDEPRSELQPIAIQTAKTFIRGMSPNEEEK